MRKILFFLFALSCAFSVRATTVSQSAVSEYVLGSFPIYQTSPLSGALTGNATVVLTLLFSPDRTLVNGYRLKIVGTVNPFSGASNLYKSVNGAAAQAWWSYGGGYGSFSIYQTSPDPRYISADVNDSYVITASARQYGPSTGGKWVESKGLQGSFVVTVKRNASAQVDVTAITSPTSQVVLMGTAPANGTFVDQYKIGDEWFTYHEIEVTSGSTDTTTYSNIDETTAKSSPTWRRLFYDTTTGAYTFIGTTSPTNTTYYTDYKASVDVTNPFRTYSDDVANSGVQVWSAENQRWEYHTTVADDDITRSVTGNSLDLLTATNQSIGIQQNSLNQQALATAQLGAIAADVSDIAANLPTSSGGTTSGDVSDAQTHELLDTSGVDTSAGIAAENTAASDEAAVGAEIQTGADKVPEIGTGVIPAAPAMTYSIGSWDKKIHVNGTVIGDVTVDFAFLDPLASLLRESAKWVLQLLLWWWMLRAIREMFV